MRWISRKICGKFRPTNQGIFAHLSIILAHLWVKFNTFCKIGILHYKCGVLWEKLEKTVYFEQKLCIFGQKCIFCGKNSIFATIFALSKKQKNLPNLGRFCFKLLFYKVCKAALDVTKEEHNQLGNVAFQNFGIVVETENFEQAYQKALGNGFANERVGYLVALCAL